jgi:hypothetical protein
MGNDYLLFLDESKPTSTTTTFCLAGFIIEKEEYDSDFNPKIKSIKNSYFGSQEVIFHLFDMKRTTGDFKIFRDKRIRESFWTDIKRVINDSEIKVLGACIDCRQYRSMYADGNLNDEYAITMQIIVENFVHFLIENNGKGKIFAESRQEHENFSLLNHYYEVVTKGTLYFHRNALQRYLSVMLFPPKNENNIGLQIADFIPGALSRKCTGRYDDFGLAELFSRKLYDGGQDLAERFGFKNLL